MGGGLYDFGAESRKEFRRPDCTVGLQEHNFMAQASTP